MADHTLAGSCTHCGSCCLLFMVHNVCKPAGEERCLFYVDDLETGHCLIFAHSGSIEEVIDRHGNPITADQIRWFYQNCPDWPWSGLEDLVTGRIELSDSCGFRLVRIDGPDRV